MLTTHLLQAVATLILAASPIPRPTAISPVVATIATQEYSLTDRYRNEYVNNVFADNILLTLAYMQGQVKTGEKVDWDKVRQPAQFQFVLQPGNTFAFHDQVLPQYQASVTQTTNAHFNSTEGFRSDGWLVGDGVCHLASFINVVATRAGLQVDAPTRHDFAAIPDVDRTFGTSIYYLPGQTATSRQQNLYVTNNSTHPIAFVFAHTQTDLHISVTTLE